MLDLMDARHHIEGLVAKIARLEEELEESKRETVSWAQRAEKFKGERYRAFAHTIDPVTRPSPRAIEWGILAKQPEFWAGVLGWCRCSRLCTLRAGTWATMLRR